MSKPLRQIVEKEDKKRLPLEYRRKAAEDIRQNQRQIRGRWPPASFQSTRDKIAKARYAQMNKEETEQLDEAKVRRKSVSQRANVKTKGDINREKAAKNRTLRAAVKSMKATGVKPQIGVRGNQNSWKAARRSAVEEQMNETKIGDKIEGAMNRFADKITPTKFGQAGIKATKWYTKKLDKHLGPKLDKFDRWLDKKRSKNEETELNETDAISLTVPLFIRMLEYAKEDAKTDMDLHKATERLMEIEGVVDMDSYEGIVGK